MLITDVIREAVSEYEIYFLLTAYIEAVRYCDPLHHLPEAVRELPFINSAEGVRTRAERLRAVLASPELTDGVRFVLAEALDIFAVACHRLETLETENAHPLLEAA